MKKTYLLGAMAAGLLFTGCSSDDILSTDQSKTDVDRQYYVNMNIRGEISSRAAADDGNPVAEVDFAKGESDVKNAYFVFYDENGNMVGDIVSVNLTNPIEGINGTSVDQYYQSTVSVKVYNGEADPAQVICYINPITPASLQNPLNTMQTFTREILFDEPETGGTKYFAMSNSVYYPKDGASEPQIAVEIKGNQLFATEAAAQAALTAEDASGVVDIYVERYASKLKFTSPTPEAYVTSTSLINNPEEVEVVLTFNPEKWQVNAACQESYVVKSFREENPADGMILPNNYTFTALDARLNANTTGNKWIWNNPTLHRSYWAMSPAYFTAEYPEVSADVQALPNMQQKYYSYNELIGSAAKDYEDALGFDPQDNDANAVAQYFHETTVGSKALESVNPAAAMPSVVLVGYYTMTVGGVDVRNPTFYTYLPGSNGKPQVYFEAANDGSSVIEGGESMLHRFIEQTSILFRKVDDKTYVKYNSANAADLAKLVSLCEVTEPVTVYKKNETTGELEPVKNPERYRTLQFKADANTNGIYVATTDGYKSIGTGEGQITLAEANAALMQQVGYCYKYERGAGYFNIPVKHYGWYREANTQKEAGNQFDWRLVRVGDFGMVRNHSYNVNVTKIEGLATGIGGHDNPIVPPKDPKEYFVAYRVNILKWAVVPTQNVVL